MLSGCAGDSNWAQLENSPQPAASSDAPGLPRQRGESPDSGDSQDNTTKDVRTLLAEASAARADVPAFRFTGAGVDEDGKNIRSEGCFRMSDDATRVSGRLGGHTTDVVSIDGFEYLRAGVQAWLEATGRDSADAAAVFQRMLAGGKWVKGKFADDDNTFSSLVDSAPGAVTKGAPTTFKGSQTVPLVKTNAEGVEQTYYVLAQGVPLVVGRSTSKPGTALRTETVYEKAGACAVSAPPPDMVVDAEEVDRQLETVAG